MIAMRRIAPITIHGFTTDGLLPRVPILDGFRGAGAGTIAGARGAGRGAVGASSAGSGPRGGAACIARE